MKAIAEFCLRRRWFVVGGWVLLLVGLFALSSAIGGEYRTEFELPDSESAQAIDLLEERGVTERTGFPGQIVFHAEQGVQDPAVRQTMEGFFAQVADALEGDQLQSPYDPQYRATRSRRTARSPTPSSTSPTARTSSTWRMARTVRELWQQLDLPDGLAGRARQRHLRRGGRVLQRTDRHRRRRHHPAGGLRLGAGDGAADHHRALRHRLRLRDHRHHHPIPGGARVHRSHRGDDRHRRRHRLRADHHHPLPPGAARRDGAARGGRAGARHRRAARWCSPGSRSSSRSSASS